MCSNSSLKSLSQLKTKFTWDPHGIGEKIYSNDSGQLLFFILILSAMGAGAFSGDFTTNLARQCRAFSRALKIEKLKAPLFPGPEGAGATNDWCINIHVSFHASWQPAESICEQLQKLPKHTYLHVSQFLAYRRRSYQILVY